MNSILIFLHVLACVYLSCIFLIRHIKSNPNYRRRKNLQESEARVTLVCRRRKLTVNTNYSSFVHFWYKPE